MGANNSKPEAQGSYVWKTSSPPSVSLDVLDALQTNPETDASRTRILEQHVQTRVAEELEKLRKGELDALKAAQERIASQAAKGDNISSPSRLSVSKDIEELRRKLQERKQLRALPESVEKARGDVVRCLQENDRRPLDCWKEVDSFKAEVKSLEKGWVDKVIS